MKILVTGGCGFIGSSLVRHLAGKVELVNLDALTYAANPESVPMEGMDIPGYKFVQGDICDPQLCLDIISGYKITHIIHLAAESHVDRSLTRPQPFFETNLRGTHNLISAAINVWGLDAPKENFRFLHVSTDEVFGSLGKHGRFVEDCPYRPSSPYSATKAGSDLLVHAASRSMGLPVVLSNCGNNYGPWQNPEKLVPMTINACINRTAITLHGDGSPVRDWIHVDDHVDCLLKLISRPFPQVFTRFNIGANNEMSNLQMVHLICFYYDMITGSRDSKSLIVNMMDRRGQDYRYSVDTTKVAEEIGWEPEVEFHEGMWDTIAWYLNHRDWLKRKIETL